MMRIRRGIRWEYQLAFFLWLTLISFCRPLSVQGGQQTEADKIGGTSVVVLIDFSKSFPATSKADGRIQYGLRVGDKRALNAITEVIAEMASRQWTAPVKVVWTQIQASSMTAGLLCEPFETVQKLIHTEGSVSTREEIEASLRECVASIVKVSENKENLGNYTDLSGAIAMAGDFATGPYNEKVLIVLSDFQEDLTPGARQAQLKLHGERVVVLHRPGLDEPGTTREYLDRIKGWEKRLLDNGAKSVALLPVFSVSGSRLRAALSPETQNAITSLTNLVDIKNHLLPFLVNNSQGGGFLMRLGKSLASISQAWDGPIEALWSTMGTTGLTSRALPPLEFEPKLIKKEHALNTIEEFSMAMEECALALPNLGKPNTMTDISGSIALVTSIKPASKSSILIIVSDFVSIEPHPTSSIRFIPNTRIVMVHAPSPDDRLNPNQYPTRRHEWEEWFKRCGATSVCQFSLITFTDNDLKACLASIGGN